MSFDFPATPSDGQKFTPAGGPTYIWVAATSAWKIQGSIGASGNAYVSDTPPLSPQPGQFWWESDTGNMFMWFDDGNSQQWVQVNVPNVSGLATSKARNRIVNPAMQITQEYATGTSLTASASYVADQWRLNAAVAAGAPAAAHRDIGVLYPADPDVSCWIRVNSLSTPNPTPSATDNLQFVQPLEGKRMADLKWGSAQAKPIIVRFKAASTSIVGPFCMSVRNAAVARSYVQSFTFAAIGTPQWFTFKIPGDTSGTWPTDNTSWGTLSFNGLSGSTYKTASEATWLAGNFIGTTTMANLMSAANQALDVSCVGLYLDDGSGIPPVWEMPDEASELIACQRYYAQNVRSLFSGNCTTGSNYNANVYFPVMRVAPTVSGVNIANLGFPATVGGFAVAAQPGATVVYETRTCNLTGPSAFQTHATLNARM